MNLTIRPFRPEDLPEITAIWNEVVQDGAAFPQEEFLTPETAGVFFAAQTHTAVAESPETGTICGHLCNASYAVRSQSRGLHIGERLVLDSLAQGRLHGFRIMQFNAVVASNLHARHLYERLGFVPLGIIPQGFRRKDGQYEDICPYYRVL